jgi:hypothetical protein
VCVVMSPGSINASDDLHPSARRPTELVGRRVAESRGSPVLAGSIIRKEIA